MNGPSVSSKFYGRQKVCMKTILVYLNSLMRMVTWSDGLNFARSGWEAETPEFDIESTKDTGDAAGEATVAGVDVGEETGVMMTLWRSWWNEPGIGLGFVGWWNEPGIGFGFIVGPSSVLKTNGVRYAEPGGSERLGPDEFSSETNMSEFDFDFGTFLSQKTKV